jgi:hypothetical protein
MTAMGIAPLLELLLGSGMRGAEVFGQTVRDLKGANIARKTNRMLRAYVQNAALLRPHGLSYRSYLWSIVPSSVPPKGNVIEAETRWVRTVQRDFYNVGRPLANYLVCDWLLWFWIRGEIEWFESFKADSVQKRSLAAMLDLPQTDTAFVDYCRTLTVPDGFGNLSGRPLPPRVLNECI